MKPWILLVIAVAIAAPLLISGCDKSDPTAPSMSTISLSADRTSVRLNPNDPPVTVTLTATVLDHSASAVRRVRVRFSATASGGNPGTLRDSSVVTDSNGEAKDVLTVHAADADTVVTASAAGAGEDTVTIDTAQNSAPIAKIKINGSLTLTQVHTGTDVAFSGESSMDDGSIASYAWHLDSTVDANDYDSTARSFPKTYTDPQTIVVTLNVVDNEGLTDQDSKTLTVAGNTGPTASVSCSNPVSCSVVINTPITLTGAASMDDSMILRYDWDWEGDGTADESTTTPTKSHTYTTAGSHTAELRVWDDGTTGRGCTNAFPAPPCSDSLSATATVTVTVTSQ